MLERTFRKKIAIVGSGIAGLSAAWLLSRRHGITIFEKDSRLGGHSNTVEATSAGRSVPVDTGFIVYNVETYPNLTALFRHLGVETEASDMSFSVSLDEGRLEYAGTNLDALFAQRRNLLSPRFWSMLRDLIRFYRTAANDLLVLDEAVSLRDYLDSRGYKHPFRDDHILPMAGAIWSASNEAMLDHPAKSFIRFFHNHGLLKLANRPVWRTVKGGSREYVKKLAEHVSNDVRIGCAAVSIARDDHGITVTDSNGQTHRFDAVVIAAHADQALAMLEEPSREERQLLGSFRYTRNDAVLHSDSRQMPRRRNVWSSWNHIGGGDAHNVPTVTYWMNRLQNLPGAEPLFLTLNPKRAIAPEHVLHRETYEHPQFDAAAISAQRNLWNLQGRRHTWFCGSYFGAGFHEDALQSGLAVAEELGGVRRPWDVADESGRIHVRTMETAR